MPEVRDLAAPPRRIGRGIIRAIELDFKTDLKSAMLEAVADARPRHWQVFVGWSCLFGLRATITAGSLLVIRSCG